MSDLTYQELGNSEKLTDRVEYVRRIKEDIVLNGFVIDSAERNGVAVDELKKLDREMKDRVADYDIYRQKPMYACWRCREIDCACEPPPNKGSDTLPTPPVNTNLPF